MCREPLLSSIFIYQTSNMIEKTTAKSFILAIDLSNSQGFAF